MWCLETIIALNDKACQFAREGKPISEAYKAVGIPLSNCQISKQNLESKNENEWLVRAKKKAV